MARLFGKEYHEHSNTWFFKSVITPLRPGDISYKKYLDENGNVIFKFKANPGKKKIFAVTLEVVYDKIKREIISHTCSEDGNDVCNHYLTILNFSYNNLSTDLLEKEVFQTYQTKLMNYNEFWQRITLTAKIEIGDIFNEKNDKIRFFVRSYKPMNIRLISILVSKRVIKEEDKLDINSAKEQMKALSNEELELFKVLQLNKCSYSRKGYFFTIYKSKFIKLFPIMRNLQSKLYIKETGDRISFPNEEFRVNFQVSRNNENDYRLKVVGGEQISAAFIGKTSYFFKKNNIYSLTLPFNHKVSEQIFAGGYPVKRTDLVYLASVVARQLGLLKCYIDFADDIEIPRVYHNTPTITFKLRKEDERIIMLGLLDFNDDVIIPMTVVKFPAELVRYDLNQEVCWFYIPAQIKYDIFNFLEKLPVPIINNLGSDSTLVFQGEKDVESLKKVIFEEADPTWNIVLSNELKQQFIYRVKLNPIIKAKKSSEIEWFEYKVEYKYKDLKFTHTELKKFFNSREKFLKLEDGRLLYIEDREAFQRVDEILTQSTKQTSESYRLTIYNLPYIYGLSSVHEGIKISGDQFLDKMYNAILHRKLPKEVHLEASLQSVMRSYQKLGFQWFKMLEHYGLAGILADEMGLGKTIQAISILSDLPTNSVSLVICPKTLLFNWAAEIDKFNRTLSYLIYEGSKKERLKVLKNLNVNILLASYSIILNDLDELGKIDFQYIILDEAQHIKNTTALRTKAVKKLRSHYKMSLSGTPVENNPTELWSIFDFLMPGYLPTLKKFKDEFVNNNLAESKTREKLKSLVSPFILRRKKNEVLIELPDKQEQLSYCKMTPIQEKYYLQILEGVKRKYFSDDRLFTQNYIHVLAALTKLRQVCNHPILVDRDLKYKNDLSGKFELLREMITDAVAGEKKILIFSQFVKMLQVLRRLLQELSVSYEYMDGTTKNRQQRIDNFNNNINIKTFLISLKTGGFGINLTSADTVIIVDPWWNPMGENQAIDRAHRIGQTKKVMVYKLITKNTIEEKILQLQQSKKEMFESLIESGQGFLKTITREQLQELLEYR